MTPKVRARHKMSSLIDLHWQPKWQVVDWFSGHTHGAQKDIAVLERADKECLRPLG